MQSDQKLDVVASKYHPLFSFESDVVLASRDGVLFRVPSTTLKMTSSWFRAMFTLPQSAPPSPRSTPGTQVEPVLYAAEKYDMPGPASIVRALLRTPVFADAPLRLYAAACHFGWADDARAASTRSLVLDLHAPDHRAALMRLRTADLLALFELHHTRRARFRARLAEPPFLTDVQLGDASAARCSRCRDPISYAEWRELKHAMLYELERRPAGDTVLTGLEEWPLAQACWAARCKKTMCVSPVYDKALSSKAIKEVLDSLPNAVEMPVHDTA
ncbi:hypothetical protein EDB83DRAFT_2506612 [Lactarius deliciosus]|nr:hypothetical protein EDB83DRAFT_2506612 [Lactarius deliciosus]